MSSHTGVRTRPRPGKRFPLDARSAGSGIGLRRIGRLRHRLAHSRCHRRRGHRSNRRRHRLRGAAVYAVACAGRRFLAATRACHSQSLRVRTGRRRSRSASMPRAPAIVHRAPKCRLIEGVGMFYKTTGRTLSLKRAKLALGRVIHTPAASTGRARRGRPPCPIHSTDHANRHSEDRATDARTVARARRRRRTRRIAEDARARRESDGVPDLAATEPTSRR